MNRIRKSMSRDILGQSVSGTSTLHDEVNLNQRAIVTQTMIRNEVDNRSSR